MSQILEDLGYFSLDDLLTSEERMTRETVKQFVAREVLPDIEKHFAAETFPLELIPKMADLGFFGANMKGYGCAGMNNVAYGLIMQELEALRTPDCVPSPRCRARFRCTRFMPSVPKSKNAATCPRWRKAS
jgi:alkylation response protein AidB-like acyl-CoA dehydrogenase